MHVSILDLPLAVRKRNRPEGRPLRTSESKHDGPTNVSILDLPLAVRKRNRPEGRPLQPRPVK